MPEAAGGEALTEKVAEMIYREGGLSIVMKFNHT